jgi:hypothetical protein
MARPGHEQARLSRIRPEKTSAKLGVVIVTNEVIT